MIYANKDNDINLIDFYNKLIGKEKIETVKDKNEFEVNYFAMCLLLPKNSFLEKLIYFIKINNKLNNKTIDLLSTFFSVPNVIVLARIYSLKEEIKKQEKNFTTNIKKILYKKY